MPVQRNQIASSGWAAERIACTTFDGLYTQAATAWLPPRTAPLTPFPWRQHHVHLLGRMIVVGIPRMRCHQTYADPDITPFLEALRPNDRCVGMAVQETLAVRFGAGP